MERAPIGIDVSALGPAFRRALSKAVPAAGSIAASALLLAALLSIGVMRGQRRTESSSLTVMSLAVLKGVEDGAEDAKAAEKRALVAAAAPPVTPVSEQPPEPAVTLPMPVSVLAVTAAPPSKPTVPAAVPAPAAAPSASGPAAAAASAAAPPARRGVADGLNADTPPGTSRAYAARVRSWLYAHKTYPRLARMRREEGVVNVRFILDRAGLLLDGRIIGSSGRSSLDQEAIAMMQRSSPFPKAPREIAGDRIEFTAPVAFVLPV